MRPLVSVAIITYNQEKFIEETIESCLKQTYENIELVIGDDASNDKTIDILTRYKKKYPQKIKLVLNKTNIGITSNYNKVLKECMGKYICVLGGDDRFLPTKIEKQVNFLEKNPELVFCYHDVRVFEDGTERTLYYLPREKEIKKEELTTDLLVQKGPFFAACSVCHRNLYIYCDEEIKIASDWLNWIELSYFGGYGYIPETLSEYRRHDNNITKLSIKKSENIYKELNLTLSKVKKEKLLDLNSLEDGKNKIELQMVGIYLREENIEKVLAHLEKIKLKRLFNYKKILFIKVLFLKITLYSNLKEICIAILGKKFRER